MIVCSVDDKEVTEPLCDAEWAQSAMQSVGSTFGIVRNPYALDKTTGKPLSAAEVCLAQ